MSTQAITESFRKLSPVEKVRLLQDLWDDVAGEVASAPLTESERRLLDERIQQHDENPDDLERWAKTRDDILSDLDRASGPALSSDLAAEIERRTTVSPDGLRIARLGGIFSKAVVITEDGDPIADALEEFRRDRANEH